MDIEVLKTDSGDAGSKLGLLSRDGQFSLSTKMVSKNAVKLKPKTERSFLLIVVFSLHFLCLS